MEYVSNPPEQLDPGYRGDFKESGRANVRSLKAVGLEPQHSILDMGCGLGRVAVALTQYLNERGTYAGFDVSEEGILWCAENITARHPNFRFDWADIYSATYRAEGQIAAADYTFPYPDDSFDFAFAMSLFTHLLPEGTERFLSEAARVLKPGGRFFATFFLMDDEVGELRCEPLHDCGGYRVGDQKHPEALVVYPKNSILDLYERSGFRARLRSRGDWWQHESAALGTQDCIVGRRRSSASA